MKQKKLVIDTNIIIISFFKSSSKYSMNIGLIDKIEDYLKKKIKQDIYFDLYDTIVFDTSYNSMLRTVQYYNKCFELVDDRIYIKCKKEELPKLMDADNCIIQLIKQFIDL